MRGALLPSVEANTYLSTVTMLVTAVGVHGDPDGKGAQGGAGHRLPGLGGLLLPRAPYSLCRLPGLLEDLCEPHIGLCPAIRGAVPQISSMVSE